MVLGSHIMDLMRMFAGDPEWCTGRVLTGDRDITRTDARLVKDNVGLVAGDQVFAQYAFPKGINASFTSTARMRDSIAPYSRFVRSEGEKLRETDARLASLRGELQQVRQRVDQLAA